MWLWRWISDLLFGKRDETPPDDVRFYETQHRDQIAKQVQDAHAGVASHRMN